MSRPILLIYPPYEGRFFLKSRPPFPLGLYYISAYLEKHKIKSHVQDFGFPADKRSVSKPYNLQNRRGPYYRYGWSEKKIGKWLRENLARFHDIIGISSLMSTAYRPGYDIDAMIKMIAPDKIVVLGGPHATAYPEHVRENCPAVDLVIRGEGEIAFRKFIVGEDNVSKGITRFVKNIDKLPTPKPPKERVGDEMMVVFSRGCPHNCTFCGSRIIQGRRWRHKSVPRVIEELEFYVKEYGVKKFAIEDDNLCPGKMGVTWLMELCASIINSPILQKVKFNVPHGIPVYATADQGVCELLWAAGFRKMVFPLESTNKATLKHMNKEFTPDNWKKAAGNWMEYEHPIPTEIILGYPFVDTIETMLKTMLDVNKEECLVWASHFRLNKGIPLYEMCLKEGYVQEPYDPINANDFFIETERFKTDDLKELMRISRGLNYAAEEGINVFTPSPELLRNKRFHFHGKKLTPPYHKGQVVIKGSFAFRRSQNVLAALFIARWYKGMKPIMRFDHKDQIVFAGVERSRVYRELYKIYEKQNLALGDEMDKDLKTASKIAQVIMDS